MELNKLIDAALIIVLLNYSVFDAPFELHIG